MKIKPPASEKPIPLEVTIPELETVELRAVRLYYKLGSLAAVSREMGISTYELGKLASTQEWQQELQAIRRAENAALDARLTNIFNTTLEQLEERLRGGDQTVTPGGKIISCPVSATVLVKVSQLVFEQRQITRELPTSYSAESNKLAELAAKLEELGNATKMRTIDASET